jgi:hypothetical protein
MKVNHWAGFCCHPSLRSEFVSFRDGIAPVISEQLTRVPLHDVLRMTEKQQDDRKG